MSILRTSDLRIDQCPECAKFVKNIVISENRLHEIKDIRGICKTHGDVSLYKNEWGYEEAHPETEEECEVSRKKL